LEQSKTKAMYCPARIEDYGNEGILELVLDWGGGGVGVDLGSVLQRTVDHHDKGAPMK
jgi:hypothetical protein